MLGQLMVIDLADQAEVLGNFQGIYSTKEFVNHLRRTDAYKKVAECFFLINPLIFCCNEFHHL